MYQKMQMILGGLFLTLYVLFRLARRYPDVVWLQPFHTMFPEPSEAQRAKARRWSNIHTGVEMILIGIVLPLGYVALTVMFFNSFTTIGVVSVVGGSALCIGAGVFALARSRRD